MSTDTWDPVGVDFTRLASEKNISSLERSETFIKKFYNVIIGSLVALALASLYLLFAVSFEFFIVLAFASGILFVFFFSFLSRLKKRLIKVKLAQKNGWRFNPYKASILYQEFSRQFPKIFSLGTSDRSLEDVFWGSFTKDGKTYDFISGDFNYARVTSSGKKKSKQFFKDHFFILRLSTSISHPFSLSPKTLGSRFANLFSKKDILTESIDFNKRFTFSYEGNGGQTQSSIVSVLNPKMLEDLLSFHETKAKKARSLGGTRIFFQKDCVVFTAPGPFFKANRVFTLQHLEIFPLDAKRFQKELDFFFLLARELSQNLSDSSF